MKKYKVNVNGTVYEVEIELMGEGEAISKASAKQAPKAPESPVAQGEGEAVSAPMPGTILDVKVAVGDSVKKGQVLLILEAMKMENEIMAGADGVVTSLNVSKGATVQTGEELLTIK